MANKFVEYGYMLIIIDGDGDGFGGDGGRSLSK